MTVKEACEAMLEGTRFIDHRGREIWITAVEHRGAVEISYGDPERPRAVWVSLVESDKYFGGVSV
jgi:hypothetical protein